MVDEPLAGRAYGPYEVIAALGAGGLGEVNRARDTRLGRICDALLRAVRHACEASARGDAPTVHAKSHGRSGRTPANDEVRSFSRRSVHSLG